MSGNREGGGGGGRGQYNRAPPPNPFDATEPLPPLQPLTANHIVTHGRQASLPLPSHAPSTGGGVSFHAHPHPQMVGVSKHADFQSASLARSQRANHNVHHNHIMSDHASEMDLSVGGDRLPPILHHGGHALAHVRGGGPASHELKRPDSVITTSSIVSSDTNSQAGDSSTEGSTAPPSVYAISGLYGVPPTKGAELHHVNNPSNGSKKPVVNRRRTHSGSVGHNQQATFEGNPIPDGSTVDTNGGVVACAPSTSRVVVGVASTSAEHALVSKSNSCSAPSTSNNNPADSSDFAHRRQTSQPVHIPGVGGVNAADAAEMVVKMMETRHATNLIKGHRRSHSHGHHKGGGEPNHGRHRRTGSSVIETLQTLACSGTDHDNRNESIAQFLENLRKEQQEK